MSEDEITVDFNCPTCGKNYSQSVGKLYFHLTHKCTSKNCNPCSDAKAAEFEAAVARADAAQLLNEWCEICPVEYRTEAERGKTVESRLDQASIKASDGARMARKAILFGWKGKDSGIWLAGESGAMKTRLAWRICRSAFDAKKAIHAFTAWSWQARYQDAAGKFESESWMNSICKGGLLFVDDIGKLEWSANASAAFFEMVERRTSNGKPMLFTSNHGRGDLGAMFGSSKSVAIQGTASAITRRMQEFCKAYLVEILE